MCCSVEGIGFQKLKNCQHTFAISVFAVSIDELLMKISAAFEVAKNGVSLVNSMSCLQKIFRGLANEQHLPLMLGESLPRQRWQDSIGNH